MITSLPSIQLVDRASGPKLAHGLQAIDVETLTGVRQVSPTVDLPMLAKGPSRKTRSQQGSASLTRC